MTSQRKFHRTVLQIEVLSEEPYPIDIKELEDISYDITEGHHNGHQEVTVVEVIDAATAATQLIRSGSDPEFFGLDADGNDIEGYDQ